MPITVPSNISDRLQIGDMDDGWYNINQDGSHYRVSENDLQGIIQRMGGRADSAPAPSNPYATSNLTNYSASSGGSAAPQNGSGMPGSSSQMYALAANTADPWAKNRGKYENALNQLMTTGSSSEGVDPSYEARFKGGQQALERSQAAQGFLGSGNMAQALVDYGQSQASQEYGNQYNRLAALAGIDKSSPTAAAQIMALAPGQDLAEKNAAFSWNSQSMMLPYQAQAMDIQNQMLQRQNTESQQAFNAGQYALEQQANAPQVNFGNKFTGGTGLAGNAWNSYTPTMYTTPSTEEQITQRKRALGLF